MKNRKLNKKFKVNIKNSLLPKYEK